MEFKYQGGGRVNPRANRRNVYIEVYGENLWGFHRVWIDKCDNLEYGGASYITREANTDNENIYTLSNNIIGIRLKFISWQGMFPGKKTLWIDDIPILFQLVLNDYPKERLALAEQLNRARDYISEIFPDNNVSIEFFSTIGSNGEENPIARSSNIRVGEPFRIDVEFQNDLDCTSGWIALEKDSRFIGRVRIYAVGDSKKKFRTSMLTLVYELKGKKNEFLITNDFQGSSLTASTSPSEIFSLDKWTRANILPPFTPGTGSIWVDILGYDDKDMSKYDADDSKVTLLGPGFPIRLEEGFDANRYARDVPVGLYTVRLEFRGSSVEVRRVFIFERGHQRVKIGGSGEFGIIGYLHMKGIGQHNSPVSLECIYSRGGKEILRDNIYWAQLPKGNYDVTLSPMLLPENFSVTVEPGEITSRKPDFGLLTIDDAEQSDTSNRQLVISVKIDGLSSPEVSFSKKTTQILTVGTYTLNYMVKGENIKYQAVIKINPGTETFYSVTREARTRDLPGLDEITKSDTNSTSTDSSESIKEKPGDGLTIDAPAYDTEESRARKREHARASGIHAQAL